MVRKIIRIDEEKCNGCGACAAACHEGAIAMVNGKAKLMREDYCDGLGDCLPACPTQAISFEMREAPAYDEAAVQKAKQEKKASGCSCPGSRNMNLKPQTDSPCAAVCHQPSCLLQWPVQIKLVSPDSSFFDGAHLLVAADCTAYAYASFHQDFMQGRVTVIGCPKLDAVDYSEKMTEILVRHSIQSITVARMQVPCCGGIEYAVKRAVEASGKNIPCRVVTLSLEGKILG